jgi:uncharacterized phage protein (TIGR01671 family)
MMNRVIKFRAWFDDGRSQHMFCVGDEFGTSHPLDCCRYAQQGQPVTLMQFTGLHDKNGVEIYEGDIVADYWVDKEKYDSGEYIYGSIEFIEGSFVEVYRLAHCVNREKIDGDSIIVVGNIYQNPELLK